MTKEHELLHWVKEKKTFATHEIVVKGLEMFYTRANRTKRDFLDAKLIRRMSEFEKKCKGYICKDACYTANPEAIDKYFQPELF